MTVLETVLRSMPDGVIVANLTKLSAQLDEWAAAGFDASAAELRRENALYRALRAEYRRRTGEVL